MFSWLSENVFGPIKDFFGSFFDFKSPSAKVEEADTPPGLDGTDSIYGTTPLAPGAAPGGSGPSRTSVGADRAMGAAVSGGGGNVKHVTINVESLIKGGVTFANTTYEMSRQKLKTELERLLLDVVNDVNYG